MASASMEKRLQKELAAIQRDPPAGVRVKADEISSNLSEWTVDLVGPEGTLYEGENFQLQFKFGSRYPFDSPQVIFFGSNIPVHPHVYSNGHICLSILTEDWSPALNDHQTMQSMSRPAAKILRKRGGGITMTKYDRISTLLHLLL